MLKSSIESLEGKSLITIGITAVAAISYLLSGMSTDLTSAFEMAKSADEVSELLKTVAMLQDGGVISLGAIATILTFVASVYKNFTAGRNVVKGTAIIEEASIRREAIKAGVTVKEDLTTRIVTELPKSF